MPKNGYCEQPISNLSKKIPGFQWFLGVSGFLEAWKPETWKPRIGHLKKLLYLPIYLSY